MEQRAIFPVDSHAIRGSRRKCCRPAGRTYFSRWAPTAVTATAGNAKAKVSFTAPAATGGSPITSYTVTATDHTNPARGGQTATGSGSPITVTGLTNSDHYTFTVKATNAVGTGPTSKPSAIIIPKP